MNQPQEGRSVMPETEQAPQTANAILAHADFNPAPPPEQQPAQSTPPPEPPPPVDEKPAESGGDLNEDQLRKELRKARDDAAKYRTQLREAEPIVKAHRETEERNKTELQRAQERAASFERDLAARDQQIQLLGLAARYGIPEDDYDLLGSGTPEEMESRAVRIAHMREAAIGQQAPSAPPSNRPLESLRPGASPTPPPQADNSYPEAWRPVTRGS